MGILERAWQACFADLGCAPPAASVYDDLMARYREPHRAYHTVQHLEECFAWFSQTRDLVRAPGEVALALFYHDAIYDTHAHDNEDRSAALAAKLLNRHAQEHAEAVTTLILATRHDAPVQGDAQMLVDIDLSILGAPPPRFDAYERQVRREYDWVDDGAFRAGRRRILKRFLDRPALYNSVYVRDRLEAQAQDNLARSLGALDA